GMEAMVSYIDGDPDRPLITGLVPNSQQAVPYDLPGHRTKSVLRTNTYKSGTPSEFNEISFEDATGAENMFFHAQKDQTTKVLNNRVKRVDAHEVESIGQNKSIDVGGNHQEKIGGSMNLSVGGGRGAPLLATLGGIVAAGGLDSANGSAAIDDELLQTFTQSVSAVGAAAEAASLSANSAVTGAGGFLAEGGAQQMATGSFLGGLLGKLMPLTGIVNTVIEKFRSDTIGIARTEQIGLYKNTSVGHTMTLNVGEEFIIKCGQSKLMMDKEGNVTIVGTKFYFDASGHVQINGELIDLN
ncbi:bacteriophage T4 gp5 trimerisation domain-containing protein, partial [Afifella aestuarii]|uniref:bacteriophage T4 gp5 trimerisation domain-containing protein n=1 Tax=Afifella aestuarii TaxID=1909496 RepID=UPI003CCC7178